MQFRIIDNSAVKQSGSPISSRFIIHYVLPASKQASICTHSEICPNLAARNNSGYRKTRFGAISEQMQGPEGYETGLRYQQKFLANSKHLA